MLVKVNDELDIKSDVINAVTIKTEKDEVKLVVSTNISDLVVFTDKYSYNSYIYAYLLKTLIGMQMSYERYFPYHVDSYIKDIIEYVENDIKKASSLDDILESISDDFIDDLIDDLDYFD